MQSVLDHCLKLNESITDPLGYNEVRGIAKSISRYCWKRDPHCYAMFIERQTLKGRKGGKAKGEAYSFKREQAVRYKASGMSYTEIADKLNVSRRSVIYWCK